MKKHPNLTLGLLLALFVAIGAIQGQRLDHLFEADAFYKWITAAATNERFGWAEAVDRDDPALYHEVVAVMDPLLGSAKMPAEVEEGNNSTLSKAMKERENDALIYHLAKSSELAPLRAQFLDKLRNGKLYYTQNLSYAAVMSGLKGEGSVSIFNMFFGFRKVAANFMWLQVDRYWHMGHLYKMVPLMKTCVLLDPNFVDAYLLGAWHLGYNATAAMAYTPVPLRTWSEKYQDCLGEQEKYYYLAIDFLKDGIRNNPRNYKLFFDLGYGMYRDKLNDMPNAVLYLTEAARLPHERWVPRMLYKCLEDNGEYEKALEGWKLNKERFPENTVNDRSIERLRGLIAERRSTEALEKAKTTTDVAERDRLLAESKAAQKEAYDIWVTMNEPYAVARKLRIDAMNRAEEGQYLEAVSYLDKARFEVGSLFNELSDLIIKYKLAGGLPLSVTEKKALVRDEEGVSCIGMPEAEKQKRIEALKKRRS